MLAVRRVCGGSGRHVQAIRRGGGLHSARNIEDDGYSPHKHKSFVERVAHKFGKEPNPGTLILVRHGESEWNSRDLFTGWVDVDLSERGVLEAEHGARLLLERGYTVDICYTSMLKRAIRSSWIILNEINQIYRPMIKSWRLNERMYGSLEGHSKPGLAKLFGAEQVQRWRSGLVERPPPMSIHHPYWHGREKKYLNLNNKFIDNYNMPDKTTANGNYINNIIPITESLQDTLDRTIPLWDSHILPDLKSGRNVLIVAHRNSIRGIIRHLDNIGTEDIHNVAIPNGIPLVYKFDKNMVPITHRKAAAPLRGIWLEKKGLLRAALEQEDALAGNINGYKPMETSYAHLKGYLASNPQNSYAEAFNLNSTSTSAGGDTPHAMDSINSYINNSQEHSDVCSIVSDHASFSTTASTGGSSNDALIKSLAKLENERRLLDLVDDKSKDVISSSKSQFDGYDDAYCGDIYLDHNVLNSASFHDLSKIYSDHVNNFEDDSTHIHKYVKTDKGQVLDFDQLNAVHFFANTNASKLIDLEEELRNQRGDGLNMASTNLTSAQSIPDSLDSYTAKIASNSKPDDEMAKNFAHIGDDVLARPLIIIRHGKTEHNQLGLFTGWEDALLATEGRQEAVHAGKLLRRHGIEFDVVYASWLSRAIETAWLVLNELDSLWLPIVKTWRLNERMYGALTGLSKKMIRQIYGDDQFKKWRRGFDSPPPPTSSFSSSYPGNDTRYVNYVQDMPISWFETLIRSLAHGKLEVHKKFPKAESLRDCMERTIPYFLNVIQPDSISKNQSVLIASSENAIRGLLMHLCKIPPSKIHTVEIPTGLPLVYDFKQGKIRLLEDESLGDMHPLFKYNFGTAPELLFKTKENVPIKPDSVDHISVEDIIIKVRKSDGNDDTGK